MRPSTTSTWCGADCADIPSHTFAPIISVAAIVVTSLFLEAVAQDSRLAGAGLGPSPQPSRHAERRRKQVDLRSVRQAGLFDQREARSPALRHVCVLETSIGPLGTDGAEGNLHGQQAGLADAPIVVDGQLAGLEILGNTAEEVDDH